MKNRKVLHGCLQKVPHRPKFWLGLSLVLIIHILSAPDPSSQQYFRTSVSTYCTKQFVGDNVSVYTIVHHGGNVLSQYCVSTNSVMMVVNVGAGVVMVTVVMVIVVGEVSSHRSGMCWGRHNGSRSCRLALFWSAKVLAERTET